MSAPCSSSTCDRSGQNDQVVLYQNRYILFWLVYSLLHGRELIGEGVCMLYQEMKPIAFVGSSRTDLKAFPAGARLEAGYQLQTLQYGGQARDWKPIKEVGPGVQEIRVACDEGAFRVFYVLNRPEALYVLHAFRKTTQKTQRRDIDLARARLKSLG
jgi:phage-related protein